MRCMSPEVVHQFAATQHVGRFRGNADVNCTTGCRIAKAATA
jgi:hypothetical protein